MHRTIPSPPRSRSTLRKASRALARSLVLVAVAALVPAADAGAQTSRSSSDVFQLGRGGARVLDQLRAVEPKGVQCIEQTISCGETVLSDLSTQDCESNGIYFDYYFFDGIKGQTITATMTSSFFDPFLLLYRPDLSFLEDDNSGPGLGAQIVHTLEETSPDWALAPTGYYAGVTGPYTLTLECSDDEEPPPSDGFFTDPEYPDFRFRVEITPAGGEPIDGIHLDECQEDTVCVAGAVADRPELYIRILGPRPNGYLWPTLVRFTPSAVTVEIEQIHTGFKNTYTLDAVGPGEDDLSGLQDRQGFLP